MGSSVGQLPGQEAVGYVENSVFFELPFTAQPEYINKFRGLFMARGCAGGFIEERMLKDSEPKIALFIDYDNIAIGLKDAGSQVFDVNRVMRRLLDKGRIIFKRAYADWSLFTTHKQPLHEAGIEMIDIPMRRSIGKNSADIRLVVDALDLCYTKEHIDTFVIGSGDSDFSPLVSKLKENDKQVIGFGLRGSTSHLLADNCDEFLFYEDLVDLPSNRPPLPPGLTRRQQEAFTLLLDSIASLMRENKDVLWGSLVKDAIRRKHPSFNEQRYGYNTFSNLLEDAAGFGLVGLVRDPKSGGTPVITGFGTYNGEAGSFAQSSGGATPSAAKGPSLLVQREAVTPGTQAGPAIDQDHPVRMGKAGSTPMRKERLFAPKPAAKRVSTKSAKDAEEEARSRRGEDKPVKTPPAEPQTQKPEIEAAPQEQSKITTLEPAKKPEPKKAPKPAAESKKADTTEKKAESKVEPGKETEKSEKEESMAVSKPVKKTPARKPRRATRSTSKTSDKETTTEVKTAEVKVTEDTKPAEVKTEEEPVKKTAKSRTTTTRKRATKKSTAVKQSEKKVDEKKDETKEEPKVEPVNEIVKADIAPKVKASKPVRKTARKTSPRTKTARAKKTEEVASSSSATSETKTTSPAAPKEPAAVKETPVPAGETGSAQREPGSPENRKTTSVDASPDKKEPSTPPLDKQSVMKFDQVESSPAAGDTPAQSESTSSGVKPLRSMGRVRKR